MKMTPETCRALKRLLANGPLTGFPTRRTDAELLMKLAAARFETRRDFSEAEVNEILRDWLASFCAPYGIDHVSMRRHLVDARLLMREKSGSAYRLAASAPEGEASVDLARLLEEIRQERAARKREHAGEAQ